MISESLWRRIARRRGGPARSVVSRSVRPFCPAVKVTVEMTDFATGITHSFLILPGAKAHTELTGYVQRYPGAPPHVLTVPVTIAVF